MDVHAAGYPVPSPEPATPPASGTAQREGDALPHVWRALLYERFREQSRPLVAFDSETIMPAASLWTGARAWIDVFRSAGLTAGDRLIVALPPSPAFLQILLAALWDRLTLALLPPRDGSGVGLSSIMDALDACAVVTPEASEACWTASPAGNPIKGARPLRPSTGPRTPDARLLLRTSGTTGAGYRGRGRWIALSDPNIWAVLQSHRPKLAHGPTTRVLSVLPWHHAFGLIIDLLPALLDGATVVRDPAGGRDTASLLQYGRQWSVTHCAMVPLTATRLAADAGGRTFLQGLAGGVIGGAAVPRALADVLSTTRLRAGYGQTEASPGIALGAPGDWEYHYLGQPLGCQVRISDAGELLFRGANACLGVWERGRLQRRPPGRWVATGDLVRRRDRNTTASTGSQGLIFCGRVNDVLKLANGRAVTAGHWEDRLRGLFDGIQELMLHRTADGNLGLALTVARRPERAALEEALGPLARYLTSVRFLKQAAWITTGKGSIDRARMTQVLNRERPPLRADC